MTMSITFSIVIYQINSRELSSRLENLQHFLVDDWLYTLPRTSYLNQPGNGPGSALFNESQKAAGQIALSLVYINIVLFVTGGLGSYFLARRTLRPISEAHEAQSRFTSDASHELRTPLAAMKAELEVSLRDSGLSIEEARELLESNLEEVNKLIRLSEMLLHLSRLDHDKLEVTSVDIVQSLTETLKQFSAQSSRFDITTRKKAIVRANEPAIHELIGILIDNSLKYSTPKSKISIRIFEQKGMVGFEISNEGETIPEDKLERLFDRFFRLEPSRTSSTVKHTLAPKGYGLGLSIAKKIIDVHHGSIVATSLKGKTTFTFFLAKSQNNSSKL